jgi:SAM-dependent methyltransferase
MDLGEHALAGAFVKPDQFDAEEKHPLTLHFCEKCLLVQVGESIPPATLFEDYFYRSSATKTMTEHFAQLARTLVARFKPESVLEIGCNDGILLRPLKALGVERLLGIDPAANVTPEDLPIVNAYWGTKTVGDQFDLIVANNVFAHLEDINDACEAVRLSLTPGGTFVFEVNRLDGLITGLQYDWIYHEHRYYYSLLALDILLERHGLLIYDAERLPTHGASIRYFAARRGFMPVSRKVDKYCEHERWVGLDKAERYFRFAEESQAHAVELRELVRSYGHVAGYGACGRTNTLLQYAGLGAQDIAYIVDDAPAKHGFYTPGTHIEIAPAERLAAEPPDCLIVFAWSFLDEIKPKLADFKGRVYVPLPFNIYEHKTQAAA